MTRSFYWPDYTIGPDAYKKVAALCGKFGKKVVFIGGKTALSKAAHLVREAIAGSGLTVVDEVWYGGEAAYENVDKLEQVKSIREADMVFAFGGGKALDTSKLLTHRLKKPLFTFPTIASTCACVTTVCVMYELNHEFKELCWRDAPADHVFINTQVIAEAPDKYLWAGIGDTLAKGYEPEFSARGKDLDHYDQFGITLSVLCQEPLVKYGARALAECREKKAGNALDEAVQAIIVNTGLVSNSVINDYNTSIAHAITYGFSLIPAVEENHLHGEMVAYGVLVLLMIDGKTAEIDKLLKFYKEIDLPDSCYRCFHVTADEVEQKILQKASEVNDIVVSAFPINKDILRKGLADLEAYVASKN